MKTTVIIPIKPIAKQRPRLNKNKIVYTPTKTKLFENVIKLCYGNRHFYDKEYIKVSIIFRFEVPKSYSKKRRLEALNGILKPTRADIDNYIKSVLDGLNNVAWSDDRYVVEVQAKKEFYTVNEIEVKIENV